LLQVTNICVSTLSALWPVRERFFGGVELGDFLKHFFQKLFHSHAFSLDILQALEKNNNVTGMVT
jgi:hypothetical protein